MPVPRKSHCQRGHPFDEANTRIQAGKRVCRRCIADRAKARYHKLGGYQCRDKAKCAENWKEYYKRCPQKHRERNKAERVGVTDNYIISLIADEHKELRKAARNTPELIAAYKAQLKLKRLIHERSK